MEKMEENKSGQDKKKSVRTAMKTKGKASTGKKTQTTRKSVIAAALKKTMSPLVFGLDIGTRSIVGTVGYKTEEDEFVVLAQVVREHKTRSMLDGQIHDIQAVAATITEVKEKLEDLLGRKLKDVCIAAAGRVLKTVTVKAKVNFNSETVITSEHIYSLDMLGVEKAYEQLRSEKEQEGIQFYCVGYSVIRYYQNDYPITNLEGHKANSIETELIATFLPDEVVDGLYAAVEKAGLYVANLTLEPIAAINVAIPQKFRLLNIALVDVGAGTSDISITSDGSITAYGMIPAAGDEITEHIAKRYLTDFTEAEKIKCDSTVKKQITYQDIMGLQGKLSAEQIAAEVSQTVQGITKKIADKIKELNGEKSVSAVFVVGGGGKAPGFIESLAEYLELPRERVALRGSEVLGQVKFIQKEIQADSLLVTPIGICLNYYEQKNNFIFVNINGERIKLYDNSKLTVVDAAMQIGFPNEDLFPKRGNPLTYYIEGEKRMRRGEPGEASQVKINDKEASLSDAIHQNDVIEIVSSTAGAPAEMTVSQIPEYHSEIRFTFNKKAIKCPRFVTVNEQMVSEYYQIQDGDHISIVDYYTLEQVLSFMDIVCRGKVYVNNVLAELDTKIYDNFSIACEIKKEEPDYQRLMQEYGDGQIPEAVENGSVLLESIDTQDGLMTREIVDKENERKRETVNVEEVEKKISPEIDDTDFDISVIVNDQRVTLKHKKEYILVDVLDFYPFDLSVARGEKLVTTINGIESPFTAPVNADDEIRIYWEGEMRI